MRAVEKQHYEMPDSLRFWFRVIFNLPYARHHNPFLIINRSWILTIHKDRIFWKNLLENKEIDFKNRVKICKQWVINASVRYMGYPFMLRWSFGLSMTFCLNQPQYTVTSKRGLVIRNTQTMFLNRANLIHEKLFGKKILLALSPVNYVLEKNPLERPTKDIFKIRYSSFFAK